MTAKAINFRIRLLMVRCLFVIALSAEGIGQPVHYLTLGSDTEQHGSRKELPVWSRESRGGGEPAWGAAIFATPSLRSGGCARESHYRYCQFPRACVRSHRPGQSAFRESSARV